MNKKKILGLLIIISFLSPLFIFAAPISRSQIEVILPTQNTKSEPILNAWLSPLIKGYLKDVVSSYNTHVPKENLQLNKIIVSSIFRTPTDQRKIYFDMLTKGRGIIDFLKLSDKNNSQFTAQFLHIILPIYSSKSYSKQLLGKLNSTVDKILKNSFKDSNGYIISKFLSYSLEIDNNAQTFDSMYSAMENIAEDAKVYYNLSPVFIQSLKDSLKEAISTKYPRISKTTLEESVKKNFTLLFVSEVCKLIQPDLKKQNSDLFKNPIVGKELTSWFRNAPVSSNHIVSQDVPRDQISSLENYIKTGNSFNIAADLGINSNKDIDGENIWNPEDPNNTIEIFKKALIEKNNWNFKDYRFTIIPEYLGFSPFEKALHIELIVSSQSAPAPSPIVGDKEKISEEPSLLEEGDKNMSAAERQFETPKNTNKKESNPSSKNYRKLNMKTYNRILGDPTSGKNKKFENTENKSTSNINEKEDKKAPTSSQDEEDDSDLDSAIEPLASQQE